MANYKCAGTAQVAEKGLFYNFERLRAAEM